LDRGTTKEAVGNDVGTDPQMETVGEKHRAKDN